MPAFPALARTLTLSSKHPGKLSAQRISPQSASAQRSRRQERLSDMVNGVSHHLRRTPAWRAAAFALLLAALPLSEALAGQGVLQAVAGHAFDAALPATHRCHAPADRWPDRDIRPGPQRDDPRFPRCAGRHGFEDDRDRISHRPPRDDRDGRGRFHRGEPGWRDGFDRGRRDGRFEDRWDRPRDKRRKRRPWSYTGCGPRCWLRRAERGYCGHGCDYYLGR